MLHIWRTGAGRLGLMAWALSLLAGGAVAETGWGSLRGPNADGSVRGVDLFGNEAKGLEVAWKRTLGSGYSVVVAGEGRVIALFAEGEKDIAAAFDPASGREVWRYTIGDTYTGHDGSHDGPISTPALADGKVFGLGAWGHLFALSVENGEVIWETHLVEDHKATKPHYGFSASPVVADGVLVLGIGGGEGRAIAGFNSEDGSLLWTVGDSEIHYQSPVVAEIGGKTQVLAADMKTLYGLDPATGATVWSYEHQGDERAMGGATIIPMPAGNDRLFLLHQFDASAMVQVKETGDGYTVSELWTTEGIRRSYVQPVIHDGYIYGMNNRIFSCIDAETGELKWRSREPGDGFPTLVGDHLVIITKPGTLHVAEATPEEYREVAQVELFEEHSWSTVVYADGSLFARSMGELARINPTGGGAGGGGSADWLAKTHFQKFLDEVAAAEDKATVVASFLQAQESFPVVEDTGVVHFLYQGEAEDVAIVGDLIGFRREDPMTRVPGTDLFYYSTWLEPTASTTYGFITNYGGDPVADPRNAQAGAGLFGEVSWFEMPGRRVPDYSGEPGRTGRLEKVEWESAVREKTRAAQVYLPAGYDGDEGRRYPVIYIHDGQTALENADLPRVLDHIAGTRAEPVIAVFILPDDENPAADRRDPEGYSKMFLEELLPLVEERFRIRQDRASRALFGGGGAGSQALQMALHHPETFGKVATVAAMVMDPQREFGEVLGSTERWPTVIYQTWGTYHMRSPHEAWDMAQGNRQLWQMLREHGYRPTGGELPEGFGWACWKGHLGEWVAALFPMAGDGAGKG